MNAEGAASAVVDLAAASAATATAAIVEIAATDRRAVRAMKMSPLRLPLPRPRSKTDGHGCKHPAPPVLPSPQDLPVHGHERAEDRLQGREAARPLRVRARQDRAEPYHGGLRQEAARTRARHQALAISRPAALRHSLIKCR